MYDWLSMRIVLYKTSYRRLIIYDYLFVRYNSYLRKSGTVPTEVRLTNLQRFEKLYLLPSNSHINSTSRFFFIETICLIYQAGDTLHPSLLASKLLRFYRYVRAILKNDKLKEKTTTGASGMMCGTVIYFDDSN